MKKKKPEKKTELVASLGILSQEQLVTVRELEYVCLTAERMPRTALQP